jgi:hypothetical protein
MSIMLRGLAVLAFSLLPCAALAEDPPVVETDAQVEQRATDRLSLPADGAVAEPLAVPTRNYGPTVIEQPRISVSVTADPLFTGVALAPYPLRGVYGPYYRQYYVPPVYRYGYYYRRPWYYGAYAPYPYYYRPYFGYPYGPVSPYSYGPPAVYPYPGVYAW